MKNVSIRFATLAVAVLFGCSVTNAGVAVEQQFRLVAGDTEDGDYFGYSVALEGTTAIVGAPLVNRWYGSAYLFDVSTGKLLRSLTPDLPSGIARFGETVAIGRDVAVVGGYGEYSDGFRAGTALLFDLTTGRQIAQLTADSPTAGKGFGLSLDVDGNLAIVGAHGDDVNGADYGAAYVFDATTGAQITKLIPSDGAALDNFGTSVALSGNIALVGATGDDDNGSVYVFDVTTGAQMAKLHATDHGRYESFGYSIAVHDDIALVGAPVFGAPGVVEARRVPGAAYLFDISTGSQIARLVADDGAWLDEFGGSVAIDGSTALVGAYGSDINPPYTNPDFIVNVGAAYMFDVTTGGQIAKISPKVLERLGNFGFSTALDNGKALVGAPQAMLTVVGDPTYPGATYLFDVNRQNQVPEPAAVVLLCGLAAVLLFFRQQTCRDGT